MINSVSFSGGRTSAFMCHLFKNEFSDQETEFVYTDTGAEHPKTYKFIREVNSNFNLDLVCLKAVVTPKMGESNGYEIVSIDSLKWDLSVMKANSKKYGGFTNNRPYCTEKMKNIVSKKYRQDTHKDENLLWLGIRYDEPKRLVGDHIQYEKSAYKQLVAIGMEDYEISDMFLDISENLSNLDNHCYFFIEQKTKDLLIKRITLQHKLGFKYLAQISQATKQDILDWWNKQSFDLEIGEHLGNCVYCVKKSCLKLALAAKEEPDLFDEWSEMVHDDSVRLMPADKFGKGHIYRKWQTPEMVVAQFGDATVEELRERVFKTKQYESGSCTEACEVSSLDQMDLFDELPVKKHIDHPQTWSEMDAAGIEEQMA